jgi:Mrp family chromosome partitioning ATPase
MDSIVMVVEKDKTTDSDVQKAVEMLPQEKFLGFVMNRQNHLKVKDGRYYR